jgi:hypothetical protein
MPDYIDRRNTFGKGGLQTADTLAIASENTSEFAMLLFIVQTAMCQQEKASETRWPGQLHLPVAI